MPETQFALSYGIADANAAGHTLTRVLDAAQACGGDDCPLQGPVGDGLLPALAAGHLNVLWDETITLAQNGVACQEQCPGVDGLLTVMRAISVTPRASQPAAA